MGYKDREKRERKNSAPRGFGGGYGGGYGGGGGGGYGGGGGGNFSGGGNFADRKMFDVTCSECGNPAQVPFEPKEGRPVYCRDCYRKKKAF